MKCQIIFDKIIKFLSVFIFVWIFILLMFFTKNMNYSYKREFIIPNVVIVIISLVLMIFRQKIVKFRFKNLNYDKIVKRLCIIFFILQLYIFYHTYFETGWDPNGLMTNARLIAKHGSKNVVSIRFLKYFSKYPNNLLYTLIAGMILKINSYIGLYSNSYDLMSIVFVNSIISSISSYLVYKIGNQLFNKKIAFLGFLICSCLCTFSPWNIICYSDSFCLFVPILILYLYINKKLKWYIKYILITVIGCIFLPVKPHTFMIVISIYLIEFIKFITKFNLLKLRKAITIVLISGSILLGFNYSINKVYLRYGFKLNKNLKFSYSHFLMMGSNNDNNGGYNGYDVKYSEEQPNKKIRTKNNINEFKRRIYSRKFKGNVEFMSKKILTAYNDGSFAWNKEGNFIYKSKPVTTKISIPLRNIYYGKYSKYYSTLLQFIWINILLTIFINSIIVIIKKEKINYVYLILIMSFIGLFIFELLFEVRARYLYTSVPIYIVLMMYGLNNINNFKFKNKNIQE